MWAAHCQQTGFGRGREGDSDSDRQRPTATDGDSRTRRRRRPAVAGELDCVRYGLGSPLRWAARSRFHQHQHC